MAKVSKTALFKKRSAAAKLGWDTRRKNETGSKQKVTAKKRK